MGKKVTVICVISFVFLIGIGASVYMVFGNGIQPPTNQEWETRPADRVSIHDPAVRQVINEEGEETFYVFGTHVAQAKTQDFLTWEVPHMNEYENMDNNIIFGDTDKNLEETFKWAGHDDADSAGGYNLWAPDVIWNPDFKWSNGDVGAYLMYYSASSTWRRSAIALLASQDIEGPYTYVDTIIYSGFTSEDATDGSDRNIHYEGTHLPDLIEEGVISEFNEQWVRNNGTEYNTDYAPNAIDPAPFYDENGTFWLVYGSWSGGIHLLQLEAETGKPIYPGEDGMTEDGRTIDRYFGIKLSGGYHQSGEGPYITYNEETGYYELWLTYGALQAHGGYNMRLFRSENVQGPYIDAQGNTGIIDNTSDINEQYGIKLLGNYNISGLRSGGYRAAGHNSVVQTEQGIWFNVFHTRFNRGTEEHEVRVHQMIHNEEGWPVILPYEYRGQIAELDQLSIEDSLGEYEFINHGTDNSSEMIHPESIELTAEGELVGDRSGNWELNESGNITVEIDGIQYQGILTEQLDERDESRIVFSAYGENNEMIWGIKVN
jgi:arabinan endo-1,5-alpha-L-arabinosidase